MLYFLFISLLTSCTLLTLRSASVLKVGMSCASRSLCDDVVWRKVIALLLVNIVAVDLCILL